MDVTTWTYTEFDGLPPDAEPGYFVGFDADRQPYILKWRAETERHSPACWFAISLDDTALGGAEPILHENNVGKITRWARLPLRWSAMGLSPSTKENDNGG